MTSRISLKKIFFVLAFCLHVPLFAGDIKPYQTEFFEATKVYAEKDYALNDALEFSIFDMSEVKFINETDAANLNKAKNALASLPRLFYQNLKKQILDSQVPVTLYPSDAPKYTRPLRLSIKIKTIGLKPALEPWKMRIFGQIEDKKTGETLIKFYDAASDIPAEPHGEVSLVFNKISEKMMKTLALFLKSKY